MDNEFFLSTGLPPPPQPPPMHFEPSSASSTILNWPSISSSMEIQPAELNLSRNPTQDCFFWEKSTEQSIFDSALSSLVSSPTASNSNLSGGVGDSFIIRELIGKLGNIGNSSGEIYGTPASNGNGSGSCYATPMSSPPPPAPPKLNIPMMVAKTTPLADFSADPGFAERAARFSCFGSRSFNGRTTSPFAMNNGNVLKGSAATVGTNGKLPRVSSSPSLKALASQICNNNTKKNSGNDESTVSGQQIPGRDSCPKVSGELSRKRKSVPKGKSKENSPFTASPYANSSKAGEGNEDSDPKRSKSSEGNGKKEEGSAKTNTEEEGKGNKTNSTKPPEPPKDYIHVRARRGQATDSHSLAERVRREKISERMKLLQDLVPGCNKVTGKALMLDEIINYVQSLQRQVEFLSMKLASVNTSLDFNVDALASRDIIPPTNNPMHHQAFFSNNNVQLHPNISSNGTIPQCPMDPMDTSTLTRSFNTHLPTLTQFTDPIPQYPTFCEDDLQSIVQMGFTQNPIRETESVHVQSQNLQSSNQVSHMKIEI